MKKRLIEIAIIMILILGITTGAFLIAGWMSDDIEAKSIARCPSDERVYFDFDIEGMDYTGANFIEGGRFYKPEPNEPEDKQ